MGKVQAGVVGVDWIAQVIHLPILVKLPDVEVLAICDRDKSKARFVAEKLGVRRYYDDMLQLKNVSANDVYTSTMRTAISTCLERGEALPRVL